MGAEKGISLLFVVLIMSVILAIALGLSAILVQQTKMMGEMGHSVVAFYAADTGIERVLYNFYQEYPSQSGQSGVVGGASFSASVKCSEDIDECPENLEKDSACDAANFCIKSIGEYKETKRAIETKF